jgi:hypothetical protein
MDRIYRFGKQWNSLKCHLLFPLGYEMRCLISNAELASLLRKEPTKVFAVFETGVFVGFIYDR